MVIAACIIVKAASRLFIFISIMASKTLIMKTEVDIIHLQAYLFNLSLYVSGTMKFMNIKTHL